MISGADLDEISDGILISDPEHRVVFANAAAARHLSTSHDALVHRSLDAVLDSAVVGALASSGHAEIFVDARKQWLAFRGSSDGHTIWIRDVTIEHEARRFRLLFEHSLDGILLTRPSGEILAANPAACRMLGMTEEEICAAGRNGIVDVTDPRLMHLLEERSRTGHAKGEITLIRKDGTRFPAEVSSAVFGGLDGQERTSLSFHDLTERTRAENALALLADAVALARSLDLTVMLGELARLVVPRFADSCVVDLYSDGVLRRIAVAHDDPGREWIVDEARAVPERTAGIAAVLRSGEPELVSRVTDAWLHAASFDDATYRIARAANPRSVLIVPLRARDRTIGTLSFVIVDGHRRFSEADVPIAAGIADRAALAIENARLYEAALEAKRLREEMLGIVSHDLRNPLNAIAITAQILRKENPALDGPDTIVHAVRRADRLIQDLLAAAQVEAGTLPLYKRQENPTTIVEELAELHRPQADAKSITFEVNAASDLPELLVDRHRLLQLLSNLLSNAFKFTPENGHVALRTFLESDVVVFEVSDDGIGISREQQARLFDRFWQGAHTRDAGVGLGLAIAKGIVDAHGGTIDVASETDSGATFRVRLPHSSKTRK